MPTDRRRLVTNAEALARLLEDGTPLRAGGVRVDMKAGPLGRPVTQPPTLSNAPATASA